MGFKKNRLGLIDAVPSLDKILIGGLDDDELIDNFTDLNENWFIGTETDQR